MDLAFNDQEREEIDVELFNSVFPQELQNTIFHLWNPEILSELSATRRNQSIHLLESTFSRQKVKLVEIATHLNQTISRHFISTTKRGQISYMFTSNTILYEVIMKEFLILDIYDANLAGIQSYILDSSVEEILPGLVKKNSRFLEVLPVAAHDTIYDHMVDLKLLYAVFRQRAKRLTLASQERWAKDATIFRFSELLKQFDGRIIEKYVYLYVNAQILEVSVFSDVRKFFFNDQRKVDPNNFDAFLIDENDYPWLLTRSKILIEQITLAIQKLP